MLTASPRKITIKLKLKIQLGINESAISDEYDGDADASRQQCQCSLWFRIIGMIIENSEAHTDSISPFGHNRLYGFN